MKDDFSFRIIAHIRTDFPTKFGIPRQSRLVKGLLASIVFEPEYRDEEAIKGIEGFSHLWLVWKFSQAVREDFSPTVRPPRLGGNTRMGVFATRSPFRPNPIGLSCVKLEQVIRTGEPAPVLLVSGADMTDNTPIYDIKPYISYTDSVPEALGGFSDTVAFPVLSVVFPERERRKMPPEKAGPLEEILHQDPRPAYQEDKNRVYGFVFAGFEVKFRVEENTLFVLSVEPK